jgi:hypothetical protein
MWRIQSQRSNERKEMATSSAKTGVVNGGAGGLWLLGFIGAFVYYIHFHSGTFWLVVLAFLKSLVWPAFVVYHVLHLKG